MASVYTAEASATGGRDGRAVSSDGVVDVKLAVPKEMGGGGGGANPEQLFAAGFSACFLGAVKYVAGKDKITVPSDAKVTGRVGIGPRDDGTGFGLEVDLKVSLPGLDKATAEKLLHDAEIVCPYAHATKGNIPVRISLA
jgi:osmotically inducible protein OsmC